MTRQPTRHCYCQRPPRRPPHEPAATDAFEAGREQGRGASSTPAPVERSSSPAAPPRRSTWWPPAIGRRAFLEGRRRDRHLGPWSTTANIVPWQLLRDQKRHRDQSGADRRRRQLSAGGLPSAARSPRTKLVAITHVSNAHRHDHAAGRGDHRAWPTQPAPRCWSTAAQAAAPSRPSTCRRSTPTSTLSTGHKVYGPTGIGVLYGKDGSAERHAALSGRRRDDRAGDLREDHLQERPLTASRPARRPIVEAIGLGAALDYLEAIGHEAIAAHEAGHPGLRHRAARLRSPA